MKVQKKESKQSGNPARSLILVTVCTCTAIAFAAGGRSTSVPSQIITASDIVTR